MDSANIKAVIFDMDGVLLDSETICDKAWEIVCSQMNLDAELGKRAIQECRGCNKTDSAIIIKRIFGNNFDSKLFLEHTSAEFHKIEESSGIPLMHFAKEILDYLKPKYRLALASSTRQLTAVRQLTNVNLIDYFETLTFGDQVIHSKPDPEIYLMACKSLNLNPEECIAIEDSPNGVRSAYAAGIPTIMVPDKLSPTAELQEKALKICCTLEDLKNIL